MTATTIVYRVRVIDPERPDQEIVWFDELATREAATRCAELARRDKPRWGRVVESRTVTYSPWSPAEELIG